MKIVKKQNVFKGFFELDELTVEDKLKQYKRLVLCRKRAVAVILYDTNKKKFILTSQWRPGSESEIIEVIAGIKEGTETDVDILKRECLEEVGYQIDEQQCIGEFYLSPGGSTEYVVLFFSTSLNKIEKGGGLVEEDENINIIEMSLDELLTFYFQDAKTIIAVDYIRRNKSKFL